MAVEIRDFTVTVPAGTAIAAGFTAPLAMPARVVTQINIRVPPGPRGELGFAIGSGGIPIVPYGAGSWIVTDNEDLIYPLDDAITSGAWQLIAYNTGSFPHTLRIYFLCDLLASASTGTTTTALPPGSLSSGGTGDTGTGDTGTGTGGGSGEILPPPVITPPVITPPSISEPLLLPPALPQAPGAGSGGPAPIPDALLCAVSQAGTIGLLAGGGYWVLAVQADVTALSGAGAVGVEVSAAFDQAVRSAAPRGTAGYTEANGAASE